MAFLVSQSLRTFSSILRKNATAKSLSAANCAVVPLPISALVCGSFQQPLRQISYRQSPYVETIDKSTLPEVQVVKNPPEWKYVERLLGKSATVPVPTEKTQYPSGWRPQTIDPSQAPYMIRRSKNHMVPVYLKISFRGYRRQTIIRYIQGDIHALAEELRVFLEDYTGRKMAIRINEFSGQIWIKRDYVNLIKDYLVKKGY